MSEFEYTHTPYSVVSSAVDGLWYNRNTQELAVDLHDNVYVYSGVPYERYAALAGASSVGRAFREVKRDYGPSEFLDNYDYVDFEEVTYPAVDMSAVGTPKGLTYAQDAVLNGEKVGNSAPAHLSLTPAEDRTEARRHRVLFETVSGLKSHEFPAASVDAAVEAIEDMGHAFGVDVTVKEVTTYFD